MRTTFVFTIAFLGTAWLFNAAFCLAGGHGEFLSAGRADEAGSSFQFEASDMLGGAFESTVLDSSVGGLETFAAFSTGAIFRGAGLVVALERAISAFGFESWNREGGFTSPAFDRLGFVRMALDVTRRTDHDQVSFVEQELDVFGWVWISMVMNGQSMSRSAGAALVEFEFDSESMPAMTVVPIDTTFCGSRASLSDSAALTRAVKTETISNCSGRRTEWLFANFASAIFRSVFGFFPKSVPTLSPLAPTRSIAKFGIRTTLDLFAALLAPHPRDCIRLSVIDQRS